MRTNAQVIPFTSKLGTIFEKVGGPDPPGTAPPRHSRKRMRAGGGERVPLSGFSRNIALRIRTRKKGVSNGETAV